MQYIQYCVLFDIYCGLLLAVQNDSSNLGQQIGVFYVILPLSNPCRSSACSFDAPPSALQALSSPGHCVRSLGSFSAPVHLMWKIGHGLENVLHSHTESTTHTHATGWMVMMMLYAMARRLLPQLHSQRESACSTTVCMQANCNRVNEFTLFTHIWRLRGRGSRSADAASMCGTGSKAAYTRIATAQAEKSRFPTRWGHCILTFFQFSLAASIISPSRADYAQKQNETEKWNGFKCNLSTAASVHAAQAKNAHCAAARNEWSGSHMYWSKNSVARAASKFALQL